MTLLYIFGLNMALIGMAINYDKRVGALKKEIEELKKPTPKATRRKVVTEE